MSTETFTLSPIYDSALELESTEDSCTVSLVAGDDLVLELTAVIGAGSNVSGPDIYAFAARHG